MCFSLPGCVTTYSSFVTNVLLLHYDYKYNTADLNMKLNTFLTRRFLNVTAKISMGKPVPAFAYEPDPTFMEITGNFVHVALRTSGSGWLKKRGEGSYKLSKLYKRLLHR